MTMLATMVPHGLASASSSSASEAASASPSRQQKARQKQQQQEAQQQAHFGPASPLTLSLEKLLLSAEASGDLQLAGRNLKHFPLKQHTKKFNLKDTVIAGKIKAGN